MRSGWPSKEANKDWPGQQKHKASKAETSELCPKERKEHWTLEGESEQMKAGKWAGATSSKAFWRPC